MSGGREATAPKALELSKGQAGELALNRALRSAPAAPAAEVYTGVLFERLGLPEIGTEARQRVLIASALWGVVQPDDRIPAYRLSIGARLPRTPNLAAFWRPYLRKVLADEGLIVDLRSGGYAAGVGAEGRRAGDRPRVHAGRQGDQPHGQGHPRRRRPGAARAARGHGEGGRGDRRRPPATPSSSSNGSLDVVNQRPAA